MFTIYNTKVLPVVIMCGVMISAGMIFPLVTDAQLPTTTASITGASGTDGWYHSNVVVKFETEAFAAVPMNLVYSINGGNQISIPYPHQPIKPINGSFETVNQNIPYGWESSTEGLVYTSLSMHVDGVRSVGMAYTAEDLTYIYIQNRSHPTAVVSGEYIDVSADVYALLSQDSLAYFEVWGMDNAYQNDQILSYSNYVSESTPSWTSVSTGFTVPPGVSYVYIKLGLVANNTGLVYWDDVNLLTPHHRTSDFDLSVTQNGTFDFLYHSIDSRGQTDSESSLTIKVDTSAPKPWQEFGFVQGVCDNCYETQSHIIDEQSGIQVSSAQYRYYTDYLSLQWSSWLPVPSAVIAETQSPAPNGSTQMIELKTGQVDYGNTANGPFRVQYKVWDLSGRESVSPVYGLFNPWLTIDGSLFIEGQIAVYSPDPTFILATADVVSGQTVLSLPNDGWEVSSYEHALSNTTSLNTLISQYEHLSGVAVDLGTYLPTVSGVYKRSEDVTIDSHALSAGFETSSQSTIIIIEGNLTISDNVTSILTNHTVFIVEGDVNVEAAVSNIAGIFILSGDFVSDRTGTSNSQLTVNGSVITLGELQLGRDLGIGNPENNETTPAEVFNWQPQYITDSALTAYFTGSKATYMWREVEQ